MFCLSQYGNPFYRLQIPMVRCLMGSSRSAGEQEQVIGCSSSSLLKGSHPGCTHRMIDHGSMLSSRDLCTGISASPTTMSPDLLRLKLIRSALASGPTHQGFKAAVFLLPGAWVRSDLPSCRTALMKHLEIRMPNESSAEPPFTKTRVLLPS